MSIAVRSQPDRRGSKHAPQRLGPAAGHQHECQLLAGPGRHAPPPCSSTTGTPSPALAAKSLRRAKYRWYQPPLRWKQISKTSCPAMLTVRQPCALSCVRSTGGTDDHPVGRILQPRAQRAELVRMRSGVGAVGFGQGKPGQLVQVRRGRGVPLGTIGWRPGKSTPPADAATASHAAGRHRECTILPAGRVLMWAPVRIASRSPGGGTMARNFAATLVSNPCSRTSQAPSAGSSCACRSASPKVASPASRPLGR